MGNLGASIGDIAMLDIVIREDEDGPIENCLSIIRSVPSIRRRKSMILSIY